jgi:hypothetical protein
MLRLPAGKVDRHKRDGGFLSPATLSCPAAKPVTLLRSPGRDDDAQRSWPDRGSNPQDYDPAKPVPLRELSQTPRLLDSQNQSLA